jgi:hypothetical protein
MLAKLSALLSSKVALAAIGGALVVGSTVTVAAAATGHLPDNVPFLGNTHPQSDTRDSQGNQDNEGNHAHTIAIEGTLSKYDAAAHTITVTGKADDQGENDDANDDQNHDGTPTAATPTGTPHAGSTPTGGDQDSDDGSNSKATPEPKCTIASPATITVNSNTNFNGQAKSEADLKNDIGHQVQVQATATNCANLTASKVTVGGGSDDSEHEGKAVEGKVGTVGASSFTVQPDHGNAVKVNVSSTTKFAGAAHGIGDLKSGMGVGVLGTQQSDGSINATLVATEGGDDHGGDGSGQGQHTGVSGLIASLGSNSFVVTTEDSHSVTVLVNSSTVYYGNARSFGDLKAGMRVAAEGTLQSNGSLQATQVASGD